MIPTQGEIFLILSKILIFNLFLLFLSLSYNRFWQAWKIIIKWIDEYNTDADDWICFVNLVEVECRLNEKKNRASETKANWMNEWINVPHWGCLKWITFVIAASLILLVIIVGLISSSIQCASQNRSKEKQWMNEWKIYYNAPLLSFLLCSRKKIKKQRGTKSLPLFVFNELKSYRLKTRRIQSEGKRCTQPLWFSLARFTDFMADDDGDFSGPRQDIINSFFKKTFFASSSSACAFTCVIISLIFIL